MSENFEFEKSPGVGEPETELGRILSDPASSLLKKGETALPAESAVLPETALDGAEKSALKDVAEHMSHSLFAAANKAVLDPASLSNTFFFIRGQGRAAIDSATEALQGSVSLHLEGLPSAVKRVPVARGLSESELSRSVIEPALEKALVTGNSQSLSDLKLSLPDPGDGLGAAELEGKGWISLRRVPATLLDNDLKGVAGQMFRDSDAGSLALKGLREAGGRGMLLAAGALALGYELSRIAGSTEKS